MNLSSGAAGGKHKFGFMKNLEMIARQHIESGILQRQELFAIVSVLSTFCEQYWSYSPCLTVGMIDQQL
jgi:hypothetical protein